MDYQTQQYKLLPLLATAYAMSFAGIYMMKKHVHVTTEIAEGNLDSLPEVERSIICVCVCMCVCVSVYSGIDPRCI